MIACAQNLTPLESFQYHIFTGSYWFHKRMKCFAKLSNLLSLGDYAARRSIPVRSCEVISVDDSTERVCCFASISTSLLLFHCVVAAHSKNHLAGLVSREDHRKAYERILSGLITQAFLYCCLLHYSNFIGFLYLFPSKGFSGSI